MCRNGGVPFKLAARLKAFDYIGLHRYFLTICCDDRRHLFTAPQAVDSTLMQLRRVATDEQFAVLAYCFMPDHLHLLVAGTRADSSLPEFVRLFKQQSAFAWKQATGARLWQRGDFDRVLRADEDTPDGVRYVLANPVRAGLVQSPLDYPYLGSLTMDIAELIGSVQVHDRRT